MTRAAALAFIAQHDTSYPIMVQGVVDASVTGGIHYEVMTEETAVYGGHWTVWAEGSEVYGER